MNINNDISVGDFQRAVDEWILSKGVRYFSPLTNMAILTEEVGEVARIMARTHGDQSSKPGEKLSLADELADVMWVVAAIANQEGINLGDAIVNNFAKKNIRDSRRHLDNPKLRDSGAAPEVKTIETKP